MKQSTVILPKFINDILVSEYLGLGLAKDIRVLSDILSIRDLSFYILINEPGFLFTKLIKAAKSDEEKEYYDALASSIILTGIETDNQELLKSVEVLRIELGSISGRDLLAQIVGVNSDTDDLFSSIKHIGSENDNMFIGFENASKKEDSVGSISVFIKQLMVTNKLIEIAKTALFRYWEVNYSRKYQ